MLRSIQYLLTFPYLFIPKACIINLVGRNPYITFVHVSHGSGTYFIRASIYPNSKIQETQIYLEFLQKIISYRAFSCKSSRWKFHVTLFVTSNSGDKNSTLVVCVVRKSAPWALGLTNQVFLYIIFLIFFLVLPRKSPRNTVGF